MNKTVITAGLSMALLAVSSAPAWAEDTAAAPAAPATAPIADATPPATAPAPAAAPAAGAAPAEAAAPAAPTSPVSSPAMSATLAANVKPMKLDAGPLGGVYVTGVLSGMAMYESNFIGAGIFSDEHRFMADVTNAQVVVQKVDGPIQFLLEGGAYSLPAVGFPYLRAGNTTANEFGGLPIWFLKYAPTDSFSVQAGNLPTLIGAEYAFSFQNLNIERGLIWNQENIVNRGIQANYTVGPVALSLAWSDGFFSNRYSWISGLAAWTIDSSNSLSFSGGGSVNTETVSSYATPPLQNNSSIYNLVYTHTSGPWTISPTLQYTSVPSDAVSQVTGGGLAKKLDTFGGGVYGVYTMDGGYSVAGRVEYIKANGDATDGTSLLYGGGSKAWSFTITPTWQKGPIFARAEFSYVKVNSGTPGFMFGTTFTSDSMTRLMLETGILF